MTNNLNRLIILCTCLTVNLTTTLLVLTLTGILLSSISTLPASLSFSVTLLAILLEVAVAAIHTYLLASLLTEYFYWEQPQVSPL